MEDLYVNLYYKFHYFSCGLFIGQNKTCEKNWTWAGGWSFGSHEEHFSLSSPNALLNLFTCKCLLVQLVNVLRASSLELVKSVCIVVGQ